MIAMKDIFLMVGFSLEIIKSKLTLFYDCVVKQILYLTV